MEGSRNCAGVKVERYFHLLNSGMLSIVVNHMFHLISLSIKSQNFRH